MTNLLKIIFLAFNLYFSKSESYNGSFPVEIVRELRREKKRQDKFVRRERFVRERLDRRFKNTKSKDHRHSNQRKLRRMYRNS